MGKGLELGMQLDPHNPRPTPELMSAIEELRDQLLIVLVKRLLDENGKLEIPVAEIDNTRSDILWFEADKARRVFTFEIKKKD